MKKISLLASVIVASVVATTSAHADFRGIYRYFGTHQSPMAPSYAPQVPSYATSTPSRYYNNNGAPYYSGTYNPYNNGGVNNYRYYGR